MSEVTLRPSRADDDAALAAVDRSPGRSAGASAGAAALRHPVLRPGVNHADVLVAHAGGTVAGYRDLTLAEPLGER